MAKRWHGYVEEVMRDKRGGFCGVVSLSFPCDSQEDGWQIALDWLRSQKRHSYLVYTHKIEVRFF